jgi:hypothetical protein
MDDVLLEDLVVDLGKSHYDPNQPRDPHTGKWIDATPGFADVHLVLSDAQPAVLGDFKHAPLSPEENWALHDVYGYAWGYKLLNPYLHHNKQTFVGGHGGHYEDVSLEQANIAEKAIAALDTAFAKAEPTKQALTVWRRSGSHIFGEGDMTGKDVTNLAYTSTATHMTEHGYGYESKPVLWEIRLPKGTKALVGNDFENEILLNRGGVFHVTLDEQTADGGRHVVMTYQPHRDPKDVATEDKVEVVPEAKEEDPLEEALLGPEPSGFDPAASPGWEESLLDPVVEPEPAYKKPLPPPVGHIVETWKELDLYPEGTHILNTVTFGGPDEYVKGDNGTWHYLSNGKPTGIYPSMSFDNHIQKAQVKVVNPGPQPLSDVLNPYMPKDPHDFMGMTVSAKEAPVGSFYKSPNDVSGGAYKKVDPNKWQQGNYVVDNGKIDAFKKYVLDNPALFPDVHPVAPIPPEVESPDVTSHGKTIAEVPGTLDDPDFPLLDYKGTELNLWPQHQPYEVEAKVSNYTASWAGEVNPDLRSGYGPTPGVLVFDRAFVPTKKPAMFLRTGHPNMVGVVGTTTAQDTYDRLKALIGKTLADKGYMSTSYDEKGSNMQGTPVFTLRIHAPAGTPAVFAQPFSSFSEEHEVVLARGLPFEVTGVTWNKAPSGANMFVLDVLAHPEKIKYHPNIREGQLPKTASSVKTLDALPVGTFVTGHGNLTYEKGTEYDDGMGPFVWKPVLEHEGEPSATSAELMTVRLKWQVSAPMKPEPEQESGFISYGAMEAAPVGSIWHSPQGDIVKMTVDNQWQYPTGIEPLGVVSFGEYQGWLEKPEKTIAPIDWTALVEKGVLPPGFDADLSMLKSMQPGTSLTINGVVWTKTEHGWRPAASGPTPKKSYKSDAELAKMIGEEVPF